jgi:hypothetical protein
MISSMHQLTSEDNEVLPWAGMAKNIDLSQHIYTSFFSISAKIWINSVDLRAIYINIVNLQTLLFHVLFSLNTKNFHFRVHN